MDQNMWAQTAQKVLDKALYGTNMEHSLTDIPADTECIGGGAGKSICIRKDGQQIAAITRFDTRVGESMSPTILHLVSKTGERLNFAARTIAQRAKTPLAVQGL